MLAGEVIYKSCRDREAKSYPTFEAEFSASWKSLGRCHS